MFLFPLHDDKTIFFSFGSFRVHLHYFSFPFVCCSFFLQLSLLLFPIHHIIPILLPFSYQHSISISRSYQSFPHSFMYPTREVLLLPLTSFFSPSIVLPPPSTSSYVHYPWFMACALCCCD